MEKWYLSDQAAKVQHRSKPIGSSMKASLIWHLACSIDFVRDASIMSQPNWTAVITKATSKVSTLTAPTCLNHSEVLPPNNTPAATCVKPQ
jgi:hypothetical protein